MGANSKTSTRKETSPKQSGGETVVVTLKKLVDGWSSLKNLASRDLTLKMNYAVSKAFGMVEKEVAIYNKGSDAILKKFDSASPGPMGLQLDIKSTENKKDAKKAMGLLDKHSEAAENQEVTLNHVVLIKIEDLFDALPSVVVKSNDENSDDDIIEDESRLSPKITSDLDWLILPPE